ncbi:hypothetical protein RJT34_12064 [Clitoria ternatea]|uniref:Uncharacterized protein n=1 Tax=Clitoria ternatea TaxID=43366 RepID=A0AAN9PKB2_CLITE
MSLVDILLGAISPKMKKCTLTHPNTHKQDSVRSSCDLCSKQPTTTPPSLCFSLLSLLPSSSSSPPPQNKQGGFNLHNWSQILLMIYSPINLNDAGINSSYISVQVLTIIYL